jgi:hypothetical protein
MDAAGIELLKTGALAEFEVVGTKVEPAPDGETKHVRIEMLLRRSDDDDREPEDEVECFGLGFMFVLAQMSFHDAGPRGYAEKLFVDEDEFTVGDFVDALRFVRGELRLGVDYLRGRCVKTDIVVRRDGTVVLETRGRNEVALRWIDLLQRKQRGQRAS